RGPHKGFDKSKPQSKRYHVERCKRNAQHENENNIHLMKLYTGYPLVKKGERCYSKRMQNVREAVAFLRRTYGPAAGSLGEDGALALAAAALENAARSQAKTGRGSAQNLSSFPLLHAALGRVRIKSPLLAESAAGAAPLLNPADIGLLYEASHQPGRVAKE